MADLHAFEETNCDKLLDSMRVLRPLLSGGPNNDIFHTLHMMTHSNSAYSTPMESSPTTISTEDLELLDSPTMLNSLDQDMLLSSRGNASSAMGINCDELSPLLEHSEKWTLPSEANFFSWTLHDFPSAEHNNFLHQDAPDGSSHKPAKVKSSPGLEKSIHDDIGDDIVGSKSVTYSGEKKSSSITKSSPQTGLRGFTRSDSANDLLKQFDSSDNSDAMEDEEGEKNSPNGKAPTSKNLVSERRRRKKLNERLYSLRAIVPKISKMDKASIVGDAISYVQDLQKQVEDMQADILALQSNKDGSQEGMPDCTNNVMPLMGGHVPRKQIPDHKILELEVSQMEEQTYHLRIHCKKGPGVLVQLTRALEALDFEIVNANLTSVSDHILNTIVVKVKNGEVLKTEEIRNMTLDVVPKFGLHL